LWSAGLDAYPFCEPCATREFDFSVSRGVRA
jgi:hypothetical protein